MGAVFPAITYLRLIARQLSLRSDQGDGRYRQMMRILGSMGTGIRLERYLKPGVSSM